MSNCGAGVLLPGLGELAMAQGRWFGLKILGKTLDASVFLE
jgi:hypothetical protein